MIQDGIGYVELQSWQDFYGYVTEELQDYGAYIYRGQADASWHLESSLDRLLKKQEQIDFGHLERFKQSARGRRGPNPSRIDDENEWWALGQHHGLITPLLDWTESPFVALYFAFLEESTEYNESENRAVYCLHETRVRIKCNELALDYMKARSQAGLKPDGNAFTNALVVAGQGSPAPTGPPEPKKVELVRPLTDENYRLISQRGLFVRGPDGEPIEKWVQEQFKGEGKTPVLLKISIPNKGREECLRLLNSMNINHLTLFPDLHGASEYCNQSIRVRDYGSLGTSLPRMKDLFSRLEASGRDT